MNTHYLTSSRTNPVFYLFRQTFSENFDWQNYDSEAVHQAAWHEFWELEGHQLLEHKWHKRFPEYSEQIQTFNSEEQALWLELWEKHVTNLTSKFWHILSCAFENYQNDLAKSFGQEETIDDLEECFEDLNVAEKESKKKNTSKKIVEKTEEESFLGDNEIFFDFNEKEQFQLLGLPTSFGSQGGKTFKKLRKPTDSSSDSEDEEDLIMENERTNQLHGVQKGFISKKNQRKLKKEKILTAKIPEFMRDENNRKMIKYWIKRFSLFSRFDQGIRLDRESWFSVTPEKIAKQTSRRLACDLIVDAFCGCGGNAIQFANTCGRVIAIDIDAEKLAMAKHNASIYGVSHKIEFIHADFLQFAIGTKLRPDIVFLSPPWGGPDYQKQSTFDIEKNLLPVGASHLIKLARNLSSKVGFFLPRNSNMTQVVALSVPGQQCEVEHNYLDTRMVALTAYYGEGLVKAN
ncbi:hypothetical protein KR074_009361 [Drosophila pseudoananassae]|nr:hypothetical protein KR074_009361 [Drosophila pseudoananassae]